MLYISLDLYVLFGELVSAIEMDPKLGYIIIAFVFGIASFVVYFIDFLKGTTHPHPISWLVWLITQVIATVSAWVGGGGYGAAYGVFYCFTISTILVCTLVKYQWEKVEAADWICLVVCLVGIAIWLLFGTPLISLLMATAVDVYGFYPSIRKGYYEPWSESLWGWGLMIPNIIFTVLAMQEYNELTMIYPVAMFIGTAALVILCLVRRRRIAKPVLESELS